MKYPWRISLLVLMNVVGAASAGNLILENSSFEVGNWGFDATPYAWVRSWPRVVQPQVVADDSAPHGGFSLRLDNGSGHDAMMVAFPAVHATGRTTLTLSFFARANAEGTPLQASLSSGWRDIVPGSVTLGTNWQRYVITGEVGTDPLNENRPGWFAPSFRLASATKPEWNTVWLDAVQIEIGEKAGPYAPARTLDASLDLADHSQRRLLVYNLGEKPEATLRVATSPRIEFRARWRLRDVFSETVVAEGDLSGCTDAIGRAEVGFPLPVVTRRLFLLEADVHSGETSAHARRVYGGIADRTNLPGGPFGGSFDSFESGREHLLKPVDAESRLAHYREIPETYIALARRLGWSWVHLYRETAPCAVNPEPGIFRFADTDEVVDLLRKHDLEIMALLTGHGGPNAYSFPVWMLTGPFSTGGTWTDHWSKNRLPDVEAWGRYCQALATHFRGRISTYENFNEPGVKMSPDLYLPFNEEAWKRIKAGDPEAGVLGLCGTWDVGGDLYGWVKSCLTAGAGAFMDGIAIHGYHTQDRDYVARVREIARGITGRDFPIWDTESGGISYHQYGFPPSFAPENGGPDATFPPADRALMMARLYANEMASGIERMSWFNLNAPWTNIGRSGFSLLMFDGSPDMGLITANFLIEVFEGARPFRSLTPAGGVVAYVFERPAGPLLVYWSEEKSSTARLAVQKAKLTDLLGGDLPVVSGDGWTTLPIDGQPRFLTAPGLDAAALAAAASGMEVRGIQPLRLERTVLGLRDGQPALAVTLANRTGVERPATLTARRMPAWLETAPAWQGALPPLGNATAVLPLKIGEPDADVTLRLVAESLEYVLALPIELRVISATPEGKPWPLMDGFKLSIAHDDSGLRFHGEIRDDQVVNHKDCKSATLATWQGDCVELFFDWNRERDQDRFACDGDDTQLLCLPPGTSSATPARVVVADSPNAGNRAFPADQMTYTATRSATGWSFDLTLPWTCVEALGVPRADAVGFSVSVRDVGADWHARRHGIWAGDNENYKNTSGYGLLLLR